MPKKFNSKIKNAIIRELNKHDEGLTISEIAKKIGRHRHTITKYIYELIGSEQISVRNIGSAKLCFLNKKKSQAQMFFAFLSLLFVSATIIIAQNITNVTQNITGALVFNETNVTTVLIEEENITNNTEQITDTPIFDVDIIIENTLIRGEEYPLKIVIKNDGSLARNVFAKLLLPDGFSTEEKRKSCGDMENGDVCLFKTTILPKSISLGKKDIGVRIEYEE